MSFSIGIVGLPNVGKSTLFQAITKKQVGRENYPFCTIEPNVGTVAVPDERVDKLAELTKSAKKIYNTVEFVDIAGLVKGANEGEGLGNKFLAHIREVDAIVYVLRAFKADQIVNTQGEINVFAEKEILDTEMALKDLATVEKRLNSLARDIKAGDKSVLKEAKALEKARAFLKESGELYKENWEKEEVKALKSCQLLTLKPRLYLLNGRDSDISEEVLRKFEENNWRVLVMDILSEFDSSELNVVERQELGLSSKTRLDLLIKASHNLLDLITFFTTGPDETRAWTIKEGSTAPQAGGVIHSDFEKYFIKAEVIGWQDLLSVGGFAEARERGLIRTEGKEYIVADGDVIEIKHGR